MQYVVTWPANANSLRPAAASTHTAVTSPRKDHAVTTMRSFYTRLNAMQILEEACVSHPSHASFATVYKITLKRSHFTDEYFIIVPTGVVAQIV